MVLLQLKGSEVPNRIEDKQGNRSWLLEGHWQRQGNLQLKDLLTCRDEENPGFLQRQGSKGREEQLGDA